MNSEARKTGGRRSAIGTGTTSLLVIFTLLCFATLAMLSFTTAVSNQRMQKGSGENVTNRLAAEGIAAAALARLDDELLGAGDADAILDELGFTAGEEKDTYRLVTPIDDTNQLITEVELSGVGSYRLVAQRVEWTGEWTPEQTVGVWPG